MPRANYIEQDLLSQSFDSWELSVYKYCIVVVGLFFQLSYPYSIFSIKGFIPNDISSNIKVTSWVPQNDILAHKSTKAFISHAGFNSLYEAAFYGVPVVCVPLFGDQPSNCVQAQAVGMATGIDIMTATDDEIYHLIKGVLEEPRWVLFLG